MSIASMQRPLGTTRPRLISFTPVPDGSHECEGCCKTSGVTRYTNTFTGDLIGFACSNRCAWVAFPEGGAR